MIRQCIEEGLQEAGFEFPDQILGQFEVFLAELKKWNCKINLTAITADEEMVAKHVIDSLHMTRYAGERGRVLDIGSGAGLPAIILKIVKPDLNVTSVDANGKKIFFQRHISRMLTLRGFEPLHVRIEELAKKRSEMFDVITSRAFSNLYQFTSLAKPLLAPAGRMIAMKGPAAIDELTETKTDLHALGYEIKSVHPYELPFDCGTRNLVVIGKVGSG